MIVASNHNELTQMCNDSSK